MEILQITGLFANIITGQEYTDQQLADANYHAQDSVQEERREQAWFDIKSEDEDIYRHSYQEERQILDAVKEGNVEEAVRLSKEMDVNIGRLGGRRNTGGICRLWRLHCVPGLRLKEA